jgi:hypothetical protein
MEYRGIFPSDPIYATTPPEADVHVLKVKFGGLNGRHFLDGEVVSKGGYLIGSQKQRTSDNQ